MVLGWDLLSCTQACSWQVLGSYSAAQFLLALFSWPLLTQQPQVSGKGRIVAKLPCWVKLQSWAATVRLSKLKNVISLPACTFTRWVSRPGLPHNGRMWSGNASEWMGSGTSAAMAVGSSAGLGYSCVICLQAYLCGGPVSCCSAFRELSYSRKEMGERSMGF